MDYTKRVTVPKNDNVPNIRIIIKDKLIYDTVKNIKLSDGITIENNDIFKVSCDCLVTAGNSFAMMDGGIDGDVNYFFDYIESRVQESIITHWAGELPVGVSVILPTFYKEIPYLCYAPTMRMPIVCPHTINAYLAMRGALIECMKNTDILTISVPLLCQGVGQMDPSIIIGQINAAYISVKTPPQRDWFSLKAAKPIIL